MTSETTLKFILLGVDKATGPMRAAGSESEKTGGKIAGMGIKSKVAILALAGAAGTFAKSSISKFQQVTMESRSLQRAMGGTLEQASRYRFAAHEAGVDSEVFTKSMQQLDKRLVAATGSQKAAAAMTKTLGVNFRDANGHVKPMNDLLPQIADRFKSMADGPEKTALALKLFGKAGTGMLPFLSKGSDGIAELTKESDKFGNTLNNNAITAVTKAKVSQRQWGAAMDGLKIQIGAALLPVMTKFVDFIRQAVIPFIQQVTGWVREHQKGFQQLGEVIFKVAVGVYRQLLLPIIKEMIGWWRIVIDWVKKHREGLTQLAKILAGAVVIAVRVAIGILKIAIGVIRDVIGIVKTLGSAAVTVWRTVIQPAAQGISAAFKGAAAGLTWVWRSVISPVFGAIKTGIHDVYVIVQKVTGWIGKQWSRMIGPLKSVWNTISGIFTQITDGFNSTMDLLSGGKYVRGVPNKGPAFNFPGTTPQSSGTPRHNAQGTGWWPGGVTQKDEQGAEAVYLPRGARIATASETASQDRMNNSTRQKPSVVTNYNSYSVTVNNPLGETASVSLPAALRSASANLGGR